MPLGTVVVVIVSVPEVTVIDRFAEAVCAGLAESVTLTVICEVPCVPAPGVPVIAPVWLRLKPVGRAPAVTCQL